LSSALHNEGNYIISLGNVCRWLATQAEALGVEIFPGFAAADILFDDPEISRSHAEVETFGDKVVIRDLGSTNGTFVNGVAVRLSYLKPGDRIQIGNTVLELFAR
jgi:electron-transferring-flavoprotein dehydrogenase